MTRGIIGDAVPPVDVEAERAAARARQSAERLKHRARMVLNQAGWRASETDLQLKAEELYVGERFADVRPQIVATALDLQGTEGWERRSAEEVQVRQIPFDPERELRSKRKTGPAATVLPDLDAIEAEAELVGVLEEDAAGELESGVDEDIQPAVPVAAAEEVEVMRRRGGSQVPGEHLQKRDGIRAWVVEQLRETGGEPEPGLRAKAAAHFSVDIPKGTWSGTYVKPALETLATETRLAGSDDAPQERLRAEATTAAAPLPEAETVEAAEAPPTLPPLAPPVTAAQDPEPDEEPPSWLLVTGTRPGALRIQFDLELPADAGLRLLGELAPYASVSTVSPPTPATRAA